MGESYCHWDKNRHCDGFFCSACEHQPDDDDKPNGKAAPVQIRWVEDYAGIAPQCPSCGKEPYSLERCVFCGQKLLPNPITEEWKKPPEEVRMDCICCGGHDTMVGTRARINGHFHGRCTQCGARMME
jgi:hypothetical protein